MDFRRLKNRLMAKILTRFPWLAERSIEKVETRVSGETPWTELTKKISQCRVSIVTTGGVHLKDQTPFDMSDQDGDPSYREIPADTPKESMVITHDYYDHKDADKDINIIFPVDRLREFVKEGVIGSLSNTHYGFMGHIDAGHIETLVKKTAPETAARMKGEGVDIALLTPG